jgi:beta-glucanase (GH16 family)
MERKEFIKKVSGGIAVSSLLPFGTGLAMSKTIPDGKVKNTKNAGNVYRPEGYHLIWEDNFDGNSLNESEWFYRMDLKMSSLQRAENIKIENGKLVLAMKKESFLGMEYTGAGVVSKRRWQHGYYEVKAKLTNVDGWHHSFWIQQGTGFLTYSSDRLMEIDVFEMESTKASNHNLWIHNDGWKSEKKGWKSVPNRDLGFDASDGYHIYGYEYTSDGITFYVDGEIVHKIDATEDEYKHYAINLWITVIATHSDRESNLPAYDYYDYIRCHSQLILSYYSSLF